MLLKQNEQNMMHRSSILGGGLLGVLLLALAASPAHAQRSPNPQQRSPIPLTATQGYVIYADPVCVQSGGFILNCLSKIHVDRIPDLKQFPQSAASWPSTREPGYDQSSSAKQ